MQKKITISIIPIGPVQHDLLVFIQEKLKNTLNAEVAIQPVQILPSGLIDPRRNQFEGKSILKLLHDREDTSLYKLGVIDEDCYDRDLKFVFGESYLKGHESFVALPRFRDTDKEKFFKRVFREALHELGHAFGLLHCPNDFCIMHLSNSLTQTDKKEDSFCIRCRSLLNQSDFPV